MTRPTPDASPAPPSRRRLREALVALGAGILVVLVLLEIVLRLTGFGYHAYRGTRGADPSLEGRPVVLCMGDSMTFGVGASRGRSYPEQLGERLAAARPEDGWAVVNGGLGGANSAMVLTRMRALLSSVRPTVVTLLAGGSNRINYYGYAEFTRRGSRLDRWSAWLFHVRVVRLARFVRLTLLHRPQVAEDQPVLDGMAAGVAACARWHADRGHTLPAAFRHGADLLLLGRFEEARAAFEGASPQDSALAWGAGTALKGLRDEAAAEAAFQRCAALDPQDPNCAYGLGELLLEGAAPDDHLRISTAGRWFDQGVRVDASLAANHWGVGMARMKTGNPMGAMDAFERCVQADPEDPRCYPNLVVQAYMLGQPDRLVRFLESWAGTSRVAADNLAAIQGRRVSQDLDRWVASDLGEMIALGREAGARVLVVNYPNASDINPVLAQVAAAEGVPLADVRARFVREIAGGTPRASLYASDGTHCNDTGYGLMADVLLEAILGTEPAAP